MKLICTCIAVALSSLCSAQSINIVSFATGFSNPVDIAHPANDARLFVVQKTGLIRILNPNGTINSTAFINLSSLLTSPLGNEQGLLGLAFHPDYATNGYFYVNYTNNSGNTVIARYKVSTNPDIADPSSATILLTVNQPFSNHNGGSLKFGPDGYLYIGMGDGGSANDPGNRAQNINENLGKMLRIDVDSASPYGIPADNPYVGIAGNDEIWAIGLRNPWKFNFDSLNGDLWIADVGQNQIEEIDHVEAPLSPGLNFGWKCYEGNSVFSTCSGSATYTFPVAQYTHSGGFCSITGGYVYRGSLYPNLFGKYLFADYCSNKIGYINSTGSIVWTSAFPGTNFSTFGQDSNGEMYIAGGTNGTIYKITDTSLASNSFDSSTFELYPNPASEEVYMKTANLKFPVAIRFVDISGKTLLEREMQSQDTSINIGQLPSGLYIVSVKDTDGKNIHSKLTVK